jgi:oligoendopeptidase F
VRAADEQSKAALPYTLDVCILARMMARMKTATFTSTIAPELITWVDSRAKAEKRTRRAVLEDALKTYQRTLVQKHMRDGFMRAAKDDVLELAEWGMEDYTRVVGK